MHLPATSTRTSYRVTFRDSFSAPIWSWYTCALPLNELNFYFLYIPQLSPSLDCFHISAGRLFNGNQLSGRIPSTLGLVNKLEVLWVTYYDILNYLIHQLGFHFSNFSCWVLYFVKLLFSTVALIEISWLVKSLRAFTTSRKSTNCKYSFELCSPSLVFQYPLPSFPISISSRNLANNKLTGPIPNLTEMIHLFYV